MVATINCNLLSKQTSVMQDVSVCGKGKKGVYNQYCGVNIRFPSRTSAS